MVAYTTGFYDVHKFFRALQVIAWLPAILDEINAPGTRFIEKGENL